MWTVASKDVLSGGGFCVLRLNWIVCSAEPRTYSTFYAIMLQKCIMILSFSVSLSALDILTSVFDRRKELAGLFFGAGLTISRSTVSDSALNPVSLRLLMTCLIAIAGAGFLILLLFLDKIDSTLEQDEPTCQVSGHSQ